jgi:protein tyrosine phosphatase type 4A
MANPNVIVGMQFRIVCNKSFKYVVTSCPNPSSIEYYKDLILTNGITTIVRLCEKKYDDSKLISSGINIIDIPISDGSVPDAETLYKWIKIIGNEIKLKKNGIAVHCMSGLGRAPMFACIGLIKFDKMEPLDAVIFIRTCIPYALNTKQLNYLSNIKLNSGCYIL